MDTVQQYASRAAKTGGRQLVTLGEAGYKYLSHQVPFCPCELLQFHCKIMREFAMSSWLWMTVLTGKLRSLFLSRGLLFEVKQTN